MKSAKKSENETFDTIFQPDVIESVNRIGTAYHAVGNVVEFDLRDLRLLHGDFLPANLLQQTPNQSGNDGKNDDGVQRNKSRVVGPIFTRRLFANVMHNLAELIKSIPVCKHTAPSVSRADKYRSELVCVDGDMDQISKYCYTPIHFAYRRYVAFVLSRSLSSIAASESLT